MTEVLSQAGLPTDAAFIIREHFSFTPGAKSIAEVRTYDVKDEGCYNHRCAHSVRVRTWLLLALQVMRYSQ